MSNLALDFRQRSRLLILIIAVCLLFSTWPKTAIAQDSKTDARMVDSLFIRASSGEVKYRDLVEPSKQALIDLGARAIPQMLTKLKTHDAREMLTVSDIFKGIGEIAVDSLNVRIKSNDDFVRRLAIRCLGEIGSPKAVGPLIAGSQHEDWRTRSGIMTALGQIGVQAGASTATAGLDDTDELVVTSAAVACGKIINGIEPQKLVSSLNHPYYGVRYCAMNSLVMIGEPAIKPLIDFLSSGKWQTGLVYAVGALGKIGTKSALPVFESYIKSEDWSLRASVAEALGNIHEKKSRKILELALRGENHPYVLAKIESSLAKLRQK